MILPRSTARDCSTGAGVGALGGSGVKSSPGLMNRSRSKLVLLVVELPVASAEREQLVVRAALDDLAVLEHEDLVGAADRRQPVRDDERRAAVAQRRAGRPGSCASLSLSRLDVASSSSRIRGIGEDRARDRDPLALAAREPDAALADDRLVPFSNCSMNSSACAIRLTARMSSIGRVRRAVADVLRDRAVEQEVVLQHDAEMAPVVAQPQRRQVVAVDEDAPVVGRLNAMTRLISVLLPDPDEPTSAVVVPPARGTRRP